MDLHVVCSVWLNKHKTCNDYNIFLNPFIVIGFIEIKVRDNWGVKIHSSIKIIGDTTEIIC